VALVDVAGRAAATAAGVRDRDRSVHVRLNARRGGGRRIGVLVGARSGLLLLLARLVLIQIAGRAAAATGTFLLVSLRLRRALILVDSLCRLVLVRGAGIGRRAVTLVDVSAGVTCADGLAVVACNRDRFAHVRLHAGRGGCRRIRVLIDAVLRVLLLP